MGFLFKKKEEKLNDRQYIVVGLGNPGKEYEHTRHNVGFDAIDYLAETQDIFLNKNKFEGVTGSGYLGENKLLLLKPQTYMNLSGASVARACNFYKIPLNTNLIVIYDDVDLPLGHIRIRKNGSAGGHNGMKSIISALAGDSFIRIRMGVGAKKNDDMVSHVLGKFSGDERKVIDKSIELVSKAVLCMIEKNCDIAMNRYNTPNRKKMKKTEENIENNAVNNTETQAFKIKGGEIRNGVENEA